MDLGNILSELIDHASALHWYPEKLNVVVLKTFFAFLEISCFSRKNCNTADVKTCFF